MSVGNVSSRYSIIAIDWVMMAIGGVASSSGSLSWG